MCEGLQLGDSGAGDRIKKERCHPVLWEDVTGKTDESGSEEGKRQITGCEKIGDVRARTNRVLSPSKETGIALRVVRNVSWEGRTHLSSPVPKYL